jgi:N6-adenosine-specific RNA methylase IME4
MGLHLQGGTVADLEALIAQGRRFATIYPDPPWHFATYGESGQHHAPDMHYDTMTLDRLKALPIGDLALPDAAMFMWATAPHMAQAIELLGAWGFAFKSVAFTWIKTVRSGGVGLHWGMGYWTRANPEYVLLGTRGAPRRLAPDVHSVVVAPVAEHSAKPAEVRSRVERLVAGPYLRTVRPRAGPGLDHVG